MYNFILKNCELDKNAVIKKANDNISELIEKLANVVLSERGLCYPRIYNDDIKKYKKYCQNGECDKCRAEFKANYIKSMREKYLISK